MYKTLMLDIDAYSDLKNVRDSLSRKFGRKLSFGDVIKHIFSRRIEFANLRDELKRYIIEFANRLSRNDYVLGIVLFGSVARGNYSEGSDIDLFVIVKTMKPAYFEEILRESASLKSTERKLEELGLPSLLNPIIVSKGELKNFRAFYFDLLDYGVVVYEREETISNFLSELTRYRHKRMIMDNAEVIMW